MPFRNESNPAGVVRINLRKNSKTTVEKIDYLIEDLYSVLRYYQDSPQIIKNILIDVNYNDIIAKSRRIKEVKEEKVENLRQYLPAEVFDKWHKAYLKSEDKKKTSTL